MNSYLSFALEPEGSFREGTSVVYIEGGGRCSVTVVRQAVKWSSLYTPTVYGDDYLTAWRTSVTEYLPPTHPLALTNSAIFMPTR